MSYLAYMQLYASQVLRQKLGDRIEFVKQEKRDGFEKEIREEKLGNLELAVFKLAEKPLYELRISFNKNAGEKNGEEYCIKDITEDEMRDICESFMGLYNKMGRKGGGAGGGT